MPTELSKLIQDFARPRSRSDWKRGSYMHRTFDYFELYWATCCWMDFWHPNVDVRVEFFIYGWNTYRVTGVDILLGLIDYGISMRFLRTLFRRMTTEENLPYLVDEVHAMDSSVLPTQEDIFCWFFLYM